MAQSLVVGEYIRTPVAVKPWSPVFPEIFSLIQQDIAERDAGLAVEHIGSTSVPGLAGKGTLDIMITPPAEKVARVADLLKGLGFQGQPPGVGFPPTRPLLLGSVAYQGGTYPVHVHVIPDGSDEAAAQRGLARALRQDPRLREEYEKVKWEAVADGNTDPVPYSMAKVGWVLDVLEKLGLPSLPDPGEPPPGFPPLKQAR
jgi:dephospho-CoA kinase